MTVAGYDHYATLFPRGSNAGKDHLVVEKDGAEFRTACGLELVETGSSFTQSRQVFVSPLTEGTSVGNRTCGNCPWDEVRGAMDR